MIVTPLRFRAVTSFPNGKWRSILLTGGSERGSLRIAASSIVFGLVLIFLLGMSVAVMMDDVEVRGRRREGLVTYHPVF